MKNKKQKEKKPKLTTRAALDKLQKEVKKIKSNQEVYKIALDSLRLYEKQWKEYIENEDKGGWQNAPAPEKELEKQEEDIWWAGNYYTFSSNGRYPNKGLWVNIGNNIIKCLIKPDLNSAWHVEDLSNPFFNKSAFTQAPDSMILDYLMKGYREKGWKEGCEFKYKHVTSGIVFKAVKFDLEKQIGFRVFVIGKAKNGDMCEASIDSCTLLQIS